MLREHESAASVDFRIHYPALTSHLYVLEELDLDRALEGADVVLVHEWNPPALVARIGRHAAGAPYRLFFHDTHHRCITEPEAMARLDLRHYDGVLAFGNTIRDHYLRKGWAARAWTWHEAADTRRFTPMPAARTHGDHPTRVLLRSRWLAEKPPLQRSFRHQRAWNAELFSAHHPGVLHGRDARNREQSARSEILTALSRSSLTAIVRSHSHDPPRDDRKIVFSRQNSYLPEVITPGVRDDDPS